MLKIKLLISILFFTIISTNAQKKVNDYKYIIVPSQFEFQQNAGDYDINEMTKFLFNKYGFNALLSTEVFPKDLGENRCLALTAHLRKKSTFFTTKMKYELVNCYNEVVYTSLESASKNKEYGRAYQESINKTFKSVKSLNYQYSEPENNLVEEKVNINRVVEVNDEQKIINEGLIVKETDHEAIDDILVGLSLLYAQPIENGFQLIDDTPKRIYTVLQTNLKDVFVLKDKKGILYKDVNNWIVEFYHDNQLVKIKLDIKF
jgi:hypothetical protein